MKAPFYVHYLTDENQTNAYPTHAGIGRTRAEAEANATYYANQFRRRTVPSSRAPQWAIDEAVEALRYPCPGCGGPPHAEPCVDPRGNVLLEFAQRARDWEAAGCPALYRDGEPVK